MNFYLSNYSFIPEQILEPPSPGLGIAVVIPCFNEPNLIASLESLKKCHLPECDVEVLIVINSGIDHSPEIKDQNLETLREVRRWITDHSTARLRFFVLFFDDLPPKHAGVGLARKIGMDEAVARFDRIAGDGIIACFDADSLCDPNYLAELEKHFETHPKSPGCAVYFEHPVSGTAFDKRVYAGIIQYELHLRYYKMALEYCNLPYAFHTIGSAMAVRSSAYQRQGGMNKRKAGEDFYFLHKIIALGNFTELNSTRVIPSPRVSDRVPFGTGRAIGNWMLSDNAQYATYNFESFRLIRNFVSRVSEFYKNDYAGGIHPSLDLFLANENFSEALVEIRSNSGSAMAFKKRFFAWFDAFRVLKLVHFLRDHGFPDRPVTDEARVLMDVFGAITSGHDPESLLIAYRWMDAQAKING
jgi:glycosyltransferase involved in cell wall biosynthesis